MCALAALFQHGAATVNESGRPLRCHLVRHCLQFARAQEAAGQTREATVYYEKAGDSDAAIRLMLGTPEGAQQAMALARKARSSTSAPLLASHCLRNEDWAGACEFFLLQGRTEQAFEVATAHGVMDTFALHLPPDAPKDVHAQVALYFRDVRQHGKAARHFKLAEQLMECITSMAAHAGQLGGADRKAVLDKALALVAEAPAPQAKHLARVVMRSMGGSDEGPDVDRVFKLNLALGNTHDALTLIADAAMDATRAGHYKVRGRARHGDRFSLRVPAHVGEEGHPERQAMTARQKVRDDARAHVLPPMCRPLTQSCATRLRTSASRASQRWRCC